MSVISQVAEDIGDLVALPKTEAITCLRHVDGAMWVGCAKGYMCVLDTASRACLAQMSAHTDRVSCMVKNGAVVWSGGADRNILGE